MKPTLIPQIRRQEDEDAMLAELAELADEIRDGKVWGIAVAVHGKREIGTRNFTAGWVQGWALRGALAALMHRLCERDG